MAADLPNNVTSGPRAALDDATVEAIAQQFHLGPILHSQDMGGTYNLNLLLDTSTGKYVARIHRPWITYQRLSAVQRVKQQLSVAGLPVPVPLRLPSGAGIMASGDKLVEVERYVAHDAVADSWERYDVAFQLLGRLHAALKEAGATLRLHPPLVSNYGTPEQLLGWTQRAGCAIDTAEPSTARTRALEICSAAAEILQYLLPRWHEHSAQLPEQAIHGDYGGGNVLFSGGEVAAVLDFDFLQVAERVYELAYSLYWMMRRLDPQAHPSQLSWSKLPSMLQRYEDAAPLPLSREERQSLALETARVPLYWVGEAAFLPDPLEAVLNAAQGVEIARWMLEHRGEIGDLIA
jgi:homoserine kinase type II